MLLRSFSLLIYTFISSPTGCEEIPSANYRDLCDFRKTLRIKQERIASLFTDLDVKQEEKGVKEKSPSAPLLFTKDSDSGFMSKRAPKRKSRIQFSRARTAEYSRRHPIFPLRCSIKSTGSRKWGCEVARREESSWKSHLYSRSN